MLFAWCIFPLCLISFLQLYTRAAFQSAKNVCRAYVSPSTVIFRILLNVNCYLGEAKLQVSSVHSCINRFCRQSRHKTTPSSSPTHTHTHPHTLSLTIINEYTPLGKSCWFLLAGSPMLVKLVLTNWVPFSSFFHMALPMRICLNPFLRKKF